MNGINIDAVKHKIYDENMSTGRIGIPFVSRLKHDSKPRLRVPLIDLSENRHVKEMSPLIEPFDLKREYPISKTAEDTVLHAKKAICSILLKEDPRLLLVVGPCSIHDEKSAMEYAGRLARLKEEVRESFVIVMRSYFEKPRTSIGWKGLINDPDLNGSFDMTKGLKTARRILLAINEMGLATATELLDPTTPAYLGDLISWAAIGARTTESQTHREMASGLTMPVGFKNATDGACDPAINAIMAARTPQSFPGIDQHGRTSIVRTLGNPWGHIVLRGGNHPNYHRYEIENVRNQLLKKGLPDTIMVDCSHGNSMKDYKRQPEVWKDVIMQKANGDKSIIGLMVESHLYEGSQPFSPDLSGLKYGVSITDACIGWEKTRSLILKAHNWLKESM